MKKFRLLPYLLASTLLFCLLRISLPVSAADSIRIRIGTVAPKDTLWHDVLKEIKQSWEKISDGDVSVKIYEGGKLGDENEMVQMVQAGRIQAVGLSSVGLSRIDDSIACLQIPMMIRSYYEMDYIRQRLGSRLEKKLEDRGFKLLHWTDAGWVRTFSKQPVRTIEDLRSQKLFISAGDPESEKLYKEFNFQVVPLSLTDMIPSLQTGMIDAVNLPPLYALMNEAYRLVPNMTTVKWTPLVAGTVIDLKFWNQLPASYRSQMLEAARSAGEKYRDDIRRYGEDSIKEMQKRGLNVVDLSDSEIDAWQREAEKAYPRLRGRLTPAEFFDEAIRLRDEFRNSGQQ